MRVSPVCFALFLFLLEAGFPVTARAEIDTPGQFTQEYAETLRATLPGLKVKIAKDLELKVTKDDGGEFDVFLNNAYDVYKQDPAKKKAVIRQFVGTAADTPGMAKAQVDRSRIIPIIKDHPWLKEVRETMLSKGMKKLPEMVTEELNADLTIVYAEDTEKSMRFVSPEDLKAAKVEVKDLRALACENLRRILPKIEQRGSDGIYVMKAGGDYEASLLLLDSMWSDGQIKVKGEIVVAVPMRGLLLVTGSDDADGLERVRKVVASASTEGAYRLSPKLFVYRKGKFEEFK